MTYIAIIIALFIASMTTSTYPTHAETPPPSAALLILRVRAETPDQSQQLLATGLDVLETRQGPDLFVMGDAATLDKLRTLGFTVSVDQSFDQRAPETYFNGYHSVAEHYPHLDAVAAAHPDIATVFDFGDAWRKTKGLANGQDLKAICITKKRANNNDCALDPNTAKPRFLLISATHARELSTAEMSWRWIDELVNQYNHDPDISALLDHNEMWVVPLHNPEGRAIVETGGNGSAPYLQRKNANNTLGNCTVPPVAGNQFGVDLNRNASWDWGGVGATNLPCDLVYRGPSAASEPEEYFLEALIAQLFRDQRAPDLISAAPLTTSGLFITLHSYGNLVLVPWATDGANAPNDAALRAMAFRMSYFNNYIAGRGKEVLYSTSGSTDDQTYGVYGIPSFTYEIGGNSGTCGGFLPAYACQDSLFWPANRGALLYAAKSARMGYATGSGPSALNVLLPVTHTAQGGSLTVDALIDDNRYGNTTGSIGRPAVHIISNTELYVDVPPWANGTPIAMAAQNGSYSASAENVRATLNTTGLSLGRHILFVRGQDRSGAWGPVTAQWFWVDDPMPTPTPTATISPTPPPSADLCAPVNIAPNTAIPDNTATPTCFNLAVNVAGTVTGASLRLALAHIYVGDLRIQLISPAGITLTVLQRPGQPATLYGDSSNLISGIPITFSDGSPNNAELMGNTLLNAQVACRDDRRCVYAPNPDRDIGSTINSFAGFTSQSANGNWRICVSDLSSRDTGRLDAATLDLTCVAPSIQVAPITPEPTETPAPDMTPTPTGEVSAPNKPDQELPPAIWLPLIIQAESSSSLSERPTENRMGRG